jgi:hypothetical protein
LVLAAELDEDRQNQELLDLSQDVDVDERHRPRERGDLVGDSVLDVVGALLFLLQQRGVDRLRERMRDEPAEEPAAVPAVRGLSAVVASMSGICLVHLLGSDAISV